MVKNTIASNYKNLLNNNVEGLISALGMNQFVKLTVEQSYFFDKDFVQGRHKNLCDFANLRNCILIPVWANGLMDESDSEIGSPTSILQAVFQQICIDLYFKGTKSSSAPTVRSSSDIMHGEYELNIIDTKSSSQSSLGAPIKKLSIII